MRRFPRYLTVFLFALWSLSAVQAQRAIPPHGGVWVHDEAGLLSQQSRNEIEFVLKQERDSTSNQIAVYIIQSLEGEDISDYGNRVFREWQLGEADKDNGVLFLLSLNDREMRIEVGQGLEGVLTDAQSSRINRNELAPYFRQGDFDNGVKAAVGGIIQTIKGEYKNDDPPRLRKKRPTSWFTLLSILLFIIIASRRRGGGGRGGGGYWSSGAGWMLPMAAMGRSSGSWDSADFGGGGFSGGGGSSDSW